MNGRNTRTPVWLEPKEEVRGKPGPGMEGLIRHGEDARFTLHGKRSH